jgi:magnesium transporter
MTENPTRYAGAGAPDPAMIASQLITLHVADAVESLNALDRTLAASTLASMPVENATKLLAQPGLDYPERLIELLPVDRAATILGALHADRRADIFRRLSQFAQENLLARLDESIRVTLQQLLAYPPKSAGGIMTTEFVGIPATCTADQALKYVRAVGRKSETIYVLFVLHPETSELLRAISLRELILSGDSTPIIEVGSPRVPISVTPLTDREEVARLISKYDLLAIPVLNDHRQVIGIVTVDDIIDAIVQADTDDLQQLGGMTPLEQPYMQIDFIGMIKKRAGWLCALFLSEMLTASAMQFFQGELEKAIVLTLFIPLIMSSGGNSGSQATSLIIRALALRELRLRDWWRIVLREIPTGVTLGSILGIIGIFRIALWQIAGIFDYGPHWMLVAVTVGAALVGIVSFGSLTGSMLPFILKRAGFDPASASAPFVATLVDVTGLVIYFNVAYVILKGTLL